jgi:hypothetical protein
MTLLEFDDSPFKRRGLKPPRWLFHWVAGTARYKLTTPRDRWLWFRSRYCVAPRPGGQVWPFFTRKRAEAAARAISTWGCGPITVIRTQRANPRRVCTYEDGNRS